MKNYADQYTTASKLMEEAIAKYNEGDYKSAQTLRDNANKLFEEADKTAFLEVRDDDKLYGENRNFGVIYHIFESNMDSLLSTKTGREVLKEFTSKIKKDKVLKEEFDAYECLTSGRDIESAELFVNEATSHLPSFTADDLKYKHEDLLSTLRKVENLDEMVEIPDDDMALYEAIEYLMLNKATIKNADQVSNSKAVIREYVEKTVEKPEPEPEKTEKMDEALLNDDEKKLVEEYMGAEDKEKLFGDYKKRVIGKLNEAIQNDGDKDRWDDVYRSICEKRFNEKTALYEIAQMVEIENILG
ncbi:MAG: hypothetical protein LUD72_02660 [Bacteroidales bacterium]|nr:hypothetical protein [Bacteroidales bacterium]